MAAHGQEPIEAVGPIGITVAEMERSLAFHGDVLGFEKVSDAEVWGGDYERWQGVFGLRMRVVGMRLGDRDALGLRVAGESENHGPEQERLNNVFGVRLRITAPRAGAGPGIELLEYVAPRDGRPMPPDGRANDLAHWQTALVAGDAAAVYRRLRGSARRTLSPAVTAPGERALGFRRAFLSRDPDGHAVQVIEP